MRHYSMTSRILTYIRSSVKDSPWPLTIKIHLEWLLAYLEHNYLATVFLHTYNGPEIKKIENNSQTYLFNATYQAICIQVHSSNHMVSTSSCRYLEVWLRYFRTFQHSYYTHDFTYCPSHIAMTFKLGMKITCFKCMINIHHYKIDAPHCLSTA